MNIVIAPDSYKGSLSATDVAHTIEKAIKAVDKSIQTTVKPMADGGEGTIDALETSLRGKEINITCTGPLGENIDTSYIIVNSTTVIIEYARIAGLPLVPQERQHPDNTTSFGIGEVILDALDRGCTEFIVGIGGSGTNDCGLGMLQALGMKATNKDGDDVHMFGRDLFEITSISFKHIDKRLKDSTIKVATDVTNPLCGKAGATYIYGPQKGLKKTELDEYDRAIYSFAEKINKDTIKAEGAGAAGGLGFAFLSIGASLYKGAQLIGDIIELEQSITRADLVITGEGKSDKQTLYGKTPAYVATLAKKHNKPVILLSGSLEGNDLDELSTFFTGCFSIQTEAISIDESISQSKEHLYNKTKLLIEFLRKMNFIH